MVLRGAPSKSNANKGLELLAPIWGPGRRNLSTHHLAARQDFKLKHVLRPFAIRTENQKGVKLGTTYHHAKMDGVHAVCPSAHQRAAHWGKTTLHLCTDQLSWPSHGTSARKKLLSFTQSNLLSKFNKNVVAFLLMFLHRAKKLQRILINL